MSGAWDGIEQGNCLDVRFNVHPTWKLTLHLQATPQREAYAEAPFHHKLESRPRLCTHEADVAETV